MIAPLDPSTLVEAVDAVVRRDTPEATHHVDAGHGDYWCLSWRIDDRAGRELFVEYPGRGIAPDVLRVGVYFQDAATASATPAALEVALGSLTAHRDVLQALGAACTFTPGTSTRDDYVFTWATPDLRRWLTASCANRDLVKRWHVRAGVTYSKTAATACAVFKSSSSPASNSRIACWARAAAASLAPSGNRSVSKRLRKFRSRSIAA
jgi:hypothetical protein